MTTQSAKWTRRQFAQTLAASAAASLLPSAALAEPARFAFISSANNAIYVFQVFNSNWTPLHTHPAQSPAHLTLNPTLPILYALHDVALWNNLPRGAVSAYSIAPTGHLTLLNSQPLSLAATNPRQAAIAPNATSIAVLAPTSGIFNILPIAPDGTLHPPAIIRKQLTPDIAEIQSLLFLPDSKTLLTADSTRRPTHSFTIEGDFLLPTQIRPARAPIPAAIAPIQPSIDFPTSIVFRPA